MINTTYFSLSTTIWPVFILFSVLFTPSVFANENAEKIQREIEDFAMQTLVSSDDTNTRLKVRKLDPRQKIPSCDNYAYEALNFSPNVSNFSVKVSCANNDWFTFVNVSMSKLQQVVVATTSVSPGQLLSSQSLSVKQVDVTRLRSSTFLQPEQIIGARAKKRMRQGSIITTNMLCFVCKGDRVTITASMNGLSIKATGMALEDGNLGDSIKIENTTTDKVIIAKVLKQGEVRVLI